MQAYFQGSYGPICSRFINNVSAEVACQQLRQQSTNFTVKNNNLSCFLNIQCPLDSIVYLSEIRCSTAVDQLLSCNHSDWLSSGQCNQASCVQLGCQVYQNGTVGRFENRLAGIRLNNIEGYICDQGFSQHEADAFCRSEKNMPLIKALGFQTGQLCTNLSARGMIISNLTCPPNSTITQCTHNGLGQVDGCTANSCVAV